jgi:purine-binding chemotaxis protein CheW
MQSNEVSSTEQQLVVFDLGTESFGVDISTVREIIRMQEVTAMPNTPEYVDGVINLRGKVIPVVDLRKRFQMEATEHNKDTRIVVVDVGNHDIGVTVDAVSEVLRVPMDSIGGHEGVAAIHSSEFLIGIAKMDDRLILLLDLARMLAQVGATDGEMAEAAV